MSINIALKPELEESLTRQADVEEKAKAFRAWAENHSPRRATSLSDEAISRESLYRTDDEDIWKLR
jgi:hypothetical protein